MPKATLNPLLSSLRGRIKGLVFVRLANGETIVRTRPKRRAKRTAAEEAQNRRLSQAAAYAKSAAADPAKKAFYAALPHGPYIGVHQLAVRDFHHPPSVDNIDLSGFTGKSGEMIRIMASDDSGVAEVTVQITDMTGAVLEEGAAVLDNADSRWCYVTTRAFVAGQTISIGVTAKDRPGNSVSRPFLAYVF